jgi:hypothetical protein
MHTSTGAFNHLAQPSAIPPEEAAEILITLAQSLLAD